MTMMRMMMMMCTVVRSFGRIVPVPAHPTRLGLLSDNDNGGQVWDWRRKSLVVQLPHWTGQCTSDGRLGLYVSVRGALELIDMSSGYVVRTLIGRLAEGVFTTQTMFTTNNTHVVHFHSGRSSVRVFRVADGKLVRNHTIQLHASSFTLLAHVFSAGLCHQGLF